MRDAGGEPAAHLQDPRDLPNAAPEVVEVHQDVVRDDEVEGTVGEGQVGGVGHPVVADRIRRGGQRHERGGAVDADRVVPEPSEVPADAPLATADLERRPSGRRKKFHEPWRVFRVGVRIRTTREPGPCQRVRFPVLSVAHVDRMVRGAPMAGRRTGRIDPPPESHLAEPREYPRGMASPDRARDHPIGSRLEVVVRAIAASQAGDGIGAIAPFLDDGVVWTGVLPGMVCNGKAEVLAIIGRHPWPGRLTALSIRESGDVVAVLVEGPDLPEIEGHARLRRAGPARPAFMRRSGDQDRQRARSGRRVRAPGELTLGTLAGPTG